MKALIALSLLFGLSTAFAKDAGIPIMIGGTVEVTNLQLAKNAAGSNLIATVKYNAICSSPAAFVVQHLGKGQITILQARPELKGMATCMAISYAEQDIDLGQVDTSTLSNINVNGATLK